MIYAKKRDDGDYEIRHHGQLFLVTAREINMRSLELVVTNPMIESKFERRYESCQSFLAMHDYAAKAIFSLTDDGYENTCLKAKAILETAPV
jgi:hypothetical protein